MHISLSRCLVLFVLLVSGLVSKSLNAQSSYYQEYPSLSDRYFADIIAWPDGAFDALTSKSFFVSGIGYKHFAGLTRLLSSGDLLSATQFSGDDLF